MGALSKKPIILSFIFQPQDRPSQLKPILEEAAKRFALSKQSTVIFVDEIHRFNRLQQDVLLPYIESGEIVFVGATTENPSFEINPALLSRCKIFTFQELSKQAIAKIFIKGKEALDPDQEFTVEEEALNVLVDWSSGDARTILNYAEVLFYGMRKAGITVLSHATIEQFLQKSTAKYRKHGEAFSIRYRFHQKHAWSDDAVVYYLTRMLESGEDPLMWRAGSFGSPVRISGWLIPKRWGWLSVVPGGSFIGSGVHDLWPRPPSIWRSREKQPDLLNLRQRKKWLVIRTCLFLRLRNVHPFMKSGYGKDYHYPHDSNPAYLNLSSRIPSRTDFTLSFIGKEKKIREYLKRYGNACIKIVI